MRAAQRSGDEREAESARCGTAAARTIPERELEDADVLVGEQLRKSRIGHRQTIDQDFEKCTVEVVSAQFGRLRERFSCPAIVCGWHSDGYWKGSGRSPEGYDLNAETVVVHR